MKGILRKLIPPARWQLPVIILLGVIVGIGLLIFRASNAHSYLSDKPETCINCHVMYSQYASWNHSSHREVATCNDCHVPQDNVFRTYFFKASDGLRHATIFTARAEPQVIKIKQAGIGVVQENCIRCHQDLVGMVSAIQVTGKNHETGQGARCWDCHMETPHGTVNSLASFPHSLVPQLNSVTPEWINTFMKEKK
ncbi:MAG: cytochrome c nitrite reductase small subunit [Lentimicrobium sp.]|jgi:cytochrome c nitrite reductase small subunit|nr:cytochrome c nitrite reductase small subunit [Lentimicrobium sp.]